MKTGKERKAKRKARMQQQIEERDRRHLLKIEESRIYQEWLKDLAEGIAVIEPGDLLRSNSPVGLVMETMKPVGSAHTGGKR